MKASELRIGNYVTDEFYDSFKSVFEVDSINNKGINLLIEDDGNWTELAERWIGCEYTFDKLYGIPLTEQWLIDFGFSKIDREDEDFTYFKLNDIEFCDVTPHGFELINYELAPCKHIHQLQNLFFALTGEELTIKEKV